MVFKTGYRGKGRKDIDKGQKVIILSYLKINANITANPPCTERKTSCLKRWYCKCMYLERTIVFNKL